MSKRRVAGSRNVTPSPGTPGEGRGEGSRSNIKRRSQSKKNPHPNPSPTASTRLPPAYRERGKSFDLRIDARSGEQLVPDLAKNLKRAHQILKPPLREMSLVLVGDAVMSRLHKEYMNLSGPTDVLTFPLDEDEDRQVLSGEVFVCVPEARRQAKLRGTTVASEVLLYSLHGMLHLCGFDDRTEPDFRRMHQTEDEILTRLGVGPVFQPGK